MDFAGHGVKIKENEKKKQVLRPRTITMKVVEYGGAGDIYSNL